VNIEEYDSYRSETVRDESPARDAARWFGLSVAALGLSGALAVVLLVGRVAALFPETGVDVDFARRALVVHVDHAVLVWFLAFIAGLFHLIPGPRGGKATGIALTTAVAGAVLFTVRAFARPVPLLSNYVPVLDDPLFLAGLGLFALGVALAFVDRRWIYDDDRDGPALLPPSACDAVRFAAAAYVVALLTIAGAYLTRDPSLPAQVYYERLFWGGGHVFQVACVLAMLGVWGLLLDEIAGVRATSRRTALLLYALLLWPTLFGPGITLTNRSGTLFTWMMRLGIFPAVSVFMVAALMALARSRERWRGRFLTPAGTTLATGMTLLLAGFVLGAMIAADTTLVPAHYHLSIGAVTVSFMGGLFVLMPRLGWTVATPRLATWQPLCYGVGQGMFAGGLAVAGYWGHATRKTYGDEQIVDRISQTIGFAAAGVGGLVAMISGVLFVVVVVRGVLATRADRRRSTDPDLLDDSRRSDPVLNEVY